MNKIYLYITLLIALVGLSSCSDFLDVQPAGQLEQEKQFSDMRGFRDAMYGAYGKLATTDLYGGNLSYAFVDQIGQMSGYAASSVPAYFAGAYDYKKKEVRSIINSIWFGQYQAISYINNILKHINTTEITHPELSIMRGECLGLRAFLHFDLARLFAEDYLQSTKTSRGLPYSTSFDLNNRKLYSLHDTYQLILNDLDEAEKLLANDNVVNVEKNPTNDYMKGRAVFFNKYAVAATKARVYYSMGKYDLAAKYAKIVVDSKDNFSLKKLTSMDGVKRFPATNELIFGLYNTSLSKEIAQMFLSQTARGTFYEGRRDLEKLYETSSFTATSSDIRYPSFYKLNTPGSTQTFSFIRLLESEAQIATLPLQGFTLIRLPEMYYILSESLFDTNKEEAISYLNKVRASRGLDPVSSDKTVNREAFEKEMLHERMREMPGEGQIFYALKHYNKSFTDFTDTKTITPSTEIFVLPWPENETEFGNK